jgi:integrase
MPLTDISIKAAKPTAKPMKLFDTGGLFLIVAPSGGKWWRFKYRFQRKAKTLSLGTYPTMTLKDARERRDELRRQLARGVDPGVMRKACKESQANTFEALALEWHAKFKHTWTAEHAERIRARLKADVFPWLGAKSIRDITAPELLAVVRRIEARGALDTAHRALANCGQVFRYAIATGRGKRDISADLRGALPPVRSKHHASIIDVKAVGALLRAIDGYEGHFITRCALRLAPLVFVRPGELRAAEWRELDLDTAEWRIPGSRMKMRAVHIIPLSQQAVAILRELHPLTGRGKYVFPSLRTGERPMSENTVNAALRRLGYDKGEMTGHGFRSMASTLLNEQGWHHDAIERQLAHVERDAVRGAYNYAQYLPERRKMMQAWADHLDGLRAVARLYCRSGPPSSPTSRYS